MIFVFDEEWIFEYIYDSGKKLPEPVSMMFARFNAYPVGLQSVNDAKDRRHNGHSRNP